MKEALSSATADGTEESADRARPQALEELVTGELQPFKEAKEQWLALFERDYLLTALQQQRYNISHAARAVQIDRKHFRKLMTKYGIDIP